MEMSEDDRELQQRIERRMAAIGEVAILCAKLRSYLRLKK